MLRFSIYTKNIYIFYLQQSNIVFGVFLWAICSIFNFLFIKTYTAKTIEKKSKKRWFFGKFGMFLYLKIGVYIIEFYQCNEIEFFTWIFIFFNFLFFRKLWNKRLQKYRKIILFRKIAVIAKVFEISTPKFNATNRSISTICVVFKFTATYSLKT